MAIYSCNLASIGRTTHAAGTAGAHIRYIARQDASPLLMAEHCPLDPVEARTWIEREERADRKNARVADKIRIALPRELDKHQRGKLVREFMSQLGEGRVPWFAAIHQTGHDAHNPHAHILVRDRDRETGKRFLRLSDSARDRRKAGLEPKAVEYVRIKWEEAANQALENAGHEVRIDRRTLEAQGIERTPNIHIGPRAQTVDERVHRPRSRVKVNGAGRTIDYPLIDEGRTRKERHAEIIDLNLERDARSPSLLRREWAKFEQEQAKKDRALETELADHARRRTVEERTLRKRHSEIIGKARSAFNTEKKQKLVSLRSKFAPKVGQLKERHAAERSELASKQGKLWRRFVRAVDLTGTTKRKDHAARQFLVASHRAERKSLKAEHDKARDGNLEAVKAKHLPALNAAFSDRAKALDKLKLRHAWAETSADARRQDREADREARRKVTEEAIQMLQARASSAETGRSHQWHRGR